MNYRFSLIFITIIFLLRSAGYAMEDEEFSICPPLTYAPTGPQQEEEQKRRLQIRSKIERIELKGIVELIEHFNKLPIDKKIAAIVDAHGTITDEPTFGGKPDVKPRGAMVEILKDLQGNGRTFVVATAWPDFDLVIQQLCQLGLGETLGINDKTPPIYKPHTLQNGRILDVIRKGNVVSARWSGLDGYFRQKIFALDILGFLDADIALVIEDDPINCDRAEEEFDQTDLANTVSSLEIIQLAPPSKDKDFGIPTETIETYKTHFLLKETEVGNILKPSSPIPNPLSISESWGSKGSDEQPTYPKPGKKEDWRSHSEGSSPVLHLSLNSLHESTGSSDSDGITVVN